MPAQPATGLVRLDYVRPRVLQTMRTCSRSTYGTQQRTQFREFDRKGGRKVLTRINTAQTVSFSNYFMQLPNC